MSQLYSTLQLISKVLSLLIVNVQANLLAYLACIDACINDIGAFGNLLLAVASIHGQGLVPYTNSALLMLLNAHSICIEILTSSS